MNGACGEAYLAQLQTAQICYDEIYFRDGQLQANNSIYATQGKMAALGLLAACPNQYRLDPLDSNLHDGNSSVLYFFENNTVLVKR